MPAIDIRKNYAIRDALRHTSGFNPCMTAQIPAPIHCRLVDELKLLREKGHCTTSRLSLSVIRVASVIAGVARTDQPQPAAIEQLVGKVILRLDCGDYQETDEVAFWLIGSCKSVMATEHRCMASNQAYGRSAFGYVRFSLGLMRIARERGGLWLLSVTEVGEIATDAVYRSGWHNRINEENDPWLRRNSQIAQHQESQNFYKALEDSGKGRACTWTGRSSSTNTTTKYQGELRAAKHVDRRARARNPSRLWISTGPRLLTDTAPARGLREV